MNWKQIIYTSIITLLVTSLAGIAVNFYTKHYIDQKDVDEKIIYDIKKISQFKSNSTNISLFTVEITNIGKLKSENIKIKINFNEKVNAIDANAIISRTQETITPDKKSDNVIEYNVKELFSNDKVIINILFNKDIKIPRVIVQSSKTLGIPKSSEVISNESKDTPIKILLQILMAGLILIPALYLYGRIDYKGYGENLNNSAFLFLHSNQLVLAEKLLNKAIMNKGGSSHELSNLALIKCLNRNDTETYNALLRMAKFISTGKHGDFVISFNSFVIACNEQDELKVNNLFEELVKLNKKEFKKYLDYSLVLSHIREQNIKINNIIREQEKKYYSDNT